LVLPDTDKFIAEPLLPYTNWVYTPLALYTLGPCQPITETNVQGEVVPNDIFE